MGFTGRILGLFLGMVVSLPGFANNLNLPEIGDSSGGVITPEQEHQIGVEFMRRIRLAYALTDDPEINAWINSLGGRIATHSDSPGQTFTFFVINDNVINAFAAPGGFIGTNAGLILATESESELASVLSHEIAHVTQRHLARAYEAQEKLNIPAIAGVIAAILISTQSGEAGRATLAATQAGAIQAQIDFTRSNENEADYIGIQNLYSAGFDPRAMSVFFERLQQAARYYSKPPEFLSTHPVTSARIANARDRAANYRYRQVPDSMEFLLMREKLRVLVQPGHTVLSRYESALKNGQYNNESATRYGYARALLAVSRNSEALSHIKWLLSKDPERISYQILDADYLLATGDSDGALKLYRTALKLYPQDQALTVLYARTLLENGHAAESRNILQSHMRKPSIDAELYKLRARAEGQAGYPAEAYQSMSEYHYLNGQTNSAIQQLEQALRLPDLDFYASSKIEARLQVLKRLLKSENRL